MRTRILGPARRVASRSFARWTTSFSATAGATRAVGAGSLRWAREELRLFRTAFTAGDELTDEHTPQDIVAHRRKVASGHRQRD